MKVRWLCNRDPFGGRAGGAEKTLLTVCRYLAAEGFDVDICAPAERALGRSQLEKRLSITRLPSIVAVHLHALRSGDQSDVTVADLAHGLPWITGVGSSRHTIAFFRHLHRRTLSGQVGVGTRLIVGGIESTYPMLYHNSVFVTESQSSEEDLVRLGVRASVISRVPPGVDTALFRPGRKTDDPSLVYFGGLRAYKRPEHAVLVLRKVLEAGIAARLTIVGDGPSVPLLKQIVFNHGLNDSVTFTGRITEAEVALIISAAWLNLHCSTAEGWCLSAMEAAASGVPTVGYRVPGLRDSVAEGRSGILVKDGDFEALGQAAIQVLTSNSSWTERCVDHASHYSWAETGQNWARVVRSVGAG
jgi:glycosyltransferase involved in cell wall biosynthesis